MKKKKKLPANWTFEDVQPWVDASIRLIVLQVVRRKAKCFIIFTGRKTHRLPVKKDRILLEGYGIELIKTNNLFLYSCLDTFFNKQDFFFCGLCRGITLYATSTQPQKKNLTALFSLPYRDAIPLWVFEKQTVYTKDRAIILANNPNPLRNLSISVGALNIMFLIIALQRFLFVKIQSYSL